MADDGPLTHLKLMNRALARFAGGVIMTEDEDTELAEQVVPAYYTRAKASLAMYAWSFNGITYKLDALAQTAENDYDATALKFNNGWRYGFRLPGNRLGDPRKVLADPRNHRNPLREFLIESGTLYADRDAVWAVVGVLADPAVWHPMFTHALIELVAADVCTPITHDSKLSETLRTNGEGTPQEQGKGGLIGRAMVDDAVRARTATPQWSDPLTQAHLR